MIRELIRFVKSDRFGYLMLGVIIGQVVSLVVVVVTIILTAL